MSDLKGQARPIFHAALSLPDPTQRANYLEMACQGNERVRREVDSLLIAHDEAGQFMEAAAFGSAKLETPTPEVPTEIVDRYKLLQQIGEGGFGVVYMAEQLEPIRRRIALKIIKVGMDTKQVIARFEAERQALALMDHPNIAKVLDAGSTESGRPYFVMELVRGIPVTEYCDDRSLATEERLKLFVQICSAIQHAHQKGIIHRDIKPSNILVSTNGDRPVPKVIDFGIAKATQGRLTDKTLFTQFQQFIGTPAYMSPEQAQMSAVDVDTRSDIYSLGVLLYELLTGKPPLETDDLLNVGFDEFCRRIREEEVPLPSKRISSFQREELTTLASNRRVDPTHLPAVIRGDLDWIAMKAVDKDRSRRYATVEALAKDIERHLNREPVSAAPPSTFYLLRRFARRNRGLLVTISLIAASLVLGSLISARQAARATRAEHLAQHSLYSAEMANAKNEFDQLHVESAVSMISEYIPQPNETDLRDFEWRWLWNQCHREHFRLIGHTARLRSLGFSRDGKWLATGARDGTARLWHVETRREVWKFKGGSHCNRVGLSPDGTRLVTSFWIAAQSGSEDERLEILWDISDPQHPQELRRSPDAGLTDDLEGSNAVAGYPDLVVVDSADGAYVADKDGRMVARLSGLEAGPIGRFSFSKDGDLVAVWQRRGELCVYDTRSGTELATFRTPRGNLVGFSPVDNQLLVAAGDDGVIRGWRISGDDAPDVVLEHPGSVTMLEFSPDGRTLAVGMDRGAVRLWDVSRGTHLFTIPAEENTDPWDRHYNTFRFDFAAFAPNSRHFAVIGPRDVVSVWDTRQQKPAIRFTCSEELPQEVRKAYWSVAFSRDGSRLYAGLCLGEDGGLIDCWQREMGSNTAFQRHSPLPTSTWHRGMAVSPNGQFLATTSLTRWDRDNSTTTLWRLPELVRDKELVLLVTDSKMLNPLFCPSGKRLAITTAPAAVTIWDVATGHKTASLPHSAIPEHISWSPDGRRLASSDEGSTTKLWNVETEQVVATFQGSVCAFSPDGTILAVARNVSQSDGDEQVTGRVTLRYAPPLEEIDSRLASGRKGKRE